MNFTLAYTDYDCNKAAYDGYLLLPHNSYINSESIVQLLKKSGEIQSAVFALYFNNDKSTNGYSLPASSLEIGGYNLSFYSSDPSLLFFVPLAENIVNWEVEFTGAYFGGWSSTGNVSLQIQSSLTYIIGDLSAYSDILFFLLLDQLECTGYPDTFAISCMTEDVNKLPPLKFEYFNNTITLQSEQIWLCKNLNCSLQVEFRGASGSWALGEIFLMNTFTIFNYDNSSLGFAPAAPSTFHHDSSNSLIVLSILILSLA